MSILQGIPVFPLAFWALALLIDLIVEPWGTWIIGTLHAAFAVFLVVSIIRDWRRQRSFSQDV